MLGASLRDSIINEEIRRGTRVTDSSFSGEAEVAMGGALSSQKILSGRWGPRSVSQPPTRWTEDKARRR
ncbi:jg17837 [Pararge aegeria aegeria]|uniref:Jg17837 protein n=1 Tax=Pararge aegeria aegeria TaxID=348720 RepID=A0A8S4SC53_9NEOP|nr:jg17837 [Pararge aegeria aegeria]